MLRLARFRAKGCVRSLHSTCALCHENPLGLPHSSTRAPPTLPRRGEPVEKRSIPYAKKTIIVASGKGGVGKSTIAANLAVALALRSNDNDMQQGQCAQLHPRPRVGLLDLDLFGPSVPKLMGLENSDEPGLTSSGALVPISNHGLPCMSMGLLLPRPTKSDGSVGSSEDVAVVWRGLMVQKAVQQLLFDVDWREGAGTRDASLGPGLDVLVVDMPPGTGDVPLTVGQLVNVDAAVIVSMPQDLSMSDVRRGIAMFKKLSIPISGLVLNTSYFLCPSCSTQHHLFGQLDSFRRTASQLAIPILGELPLVPAVSNGSDRGAPFMLTSNARQEALTRAELEWKNTMNKIASRLWDVIGGLT